MGPDKLGDEFPEMIPPVLAVLPTFAGDNFYHITVGQPEDQDFSIRSLLPFPEEFPEEERSEEVMWIQLANVKPGKREKFLELRKRLLAKLALRSSLDVRSSQICDRLRYAIARSAIASRASTTV